MDNNTRREVWANQVREDKAAAAEVRLTQEADQLQELEELRKEEEAEKKEREKKKPKLKEFVTNKPVGDTTQLCPLHYAIHKLDKHDYIELYYFMLKGCTEVVKLDHTIA